jgi:hypothetical protein
MKLTLGQLKNSEPALVALSNCTLPITIAYRISKALKVIASELADLEDARQKLVQKYGVEKEGNVVVIEENLNMFVEELNPLLQEEIEIPLEPITVESLPDSVNLSPMQLSQLSFFIVD